MGKTNRGGKKKRKKEDDEPRSEDETSSESEMEETMTNSGLLLVSNFSKLQNYFKSQLQCVKKILYIKINNNDSSSLTNQIPNIYSKLTSHVQDLDVRLILKPDDQIKKISTNHPIDIILYDQALSAEIDNLRQTVLNLKSEHTLQSLDLEDSEPPVTSEVTVTTYDYVVLGGTFDRLHNGHKILLSQAALRTSKLLTVGVTDVNMIQSKKLWELIEPVETRIRSVLDFLTDVNPTIDYNVLPIQDMYGPTKDDPRFQLIVVSEETARGGDKVNEKRVENGLRTLDKFVIGLAEDAMRSADEETKCSSSNKRMRLLGTLLRPPVPNPDIPEWPYVIGLAGGIASGKSNVAAKLKAKGAAIINCDIVAHELYKPGQPLNSRLAETFGGDVITAGGEVDRKKLGQIVFSDTAQLDKLNALVWPAVIEEAERRIRTLGSEGCRVVVMEAAVMVRAKWYTRCHQLWAVVVPPDEAIKRIQERNNLTEEEARQRVMAQPSNLDQVANANVVFSPYWSYDHTQSQVDKAWDVLEAYLSQRGGK